MKESPLVNALRVLATKLGARLFRNQVGLYRLRDGRVIRSGLAVGSSDLIGWHSVTITPAMVGRRIAVFVAVECKSPGGRVDIKQTAWIDAVKSAGGIAGIARSESDLQDLLTDL